VKITSHTRFLGVLGAPVTHSRSPAMQNAALEALGLDYVYLAFAVAPGRLHDAIAGAQALGVRGLNVTIPHKEAVLALCRPDDNARAVGAVNTLTFEADGTVTGANTDVHGFKMLCSEAGADVRGRALVLGAGGAARAVIAALRETASSTLVVSRTARTIEGTQVLGWPRTAPEWERLLVETDLLIDATPRGLDDEPADPDLKVLPPNAVVLDLVVRQETPLVRAARERGLRAAAGASMLVHQGAASLELWVGLRPPLDVMRAALDAALVIS
jgi:shikimate dehydrogenase